MHVAILSKVYPTLSVSELMTKVIVTDASSEESVVGALQRAGFTGPQLVEHLAGAVARADREIGRALHPDPAIVERASTIAHALMAV